MGGRDRGTSLEWLTRRLGSQGGSDRLGADPTQWLSCASTLLDCRAHFRLAFYVGRLSKDYEVLPSSEEAWIYLAMIRIMVRRLAQTQT